MRVVELDRSLAPEKREVLPSWSVLIDHLEPADDVLTRRRAEHVLLTEPQLFALKIVVIGIQNSSDVLCYVAV